MVRNTAKRTNKSAMRSGHAGSKTKDTASSDFWNNDIVQNPDGVLDVIYAALYGSRESEPTKLKHERSRAHPTPARFARRPSPSRGG